MKWTPKEKIILRRALRAMKDAAETGLVSGIVHPENGAKASPSDTLRSTAHFFASLWGVDINSIQVEDEQVDANRHLRPRRRINYVREKK